MTTNVTLGIKEQTLRCEAVLSMAVMRNAGEVQAKTQSCLQLQR